MDTVTYNKTKSGDKQQRQKLEKKERNKKDEN
jgi:hypothetical protein